MITPLSGDEHPLPSDAQARLIPHPGYDLFVYHIDLTSKFEFANVFIGAPPVGALFTINLLLLCSDLILIDALYTTWHYGNQKEWEATRNQKTRDQNRMEAEVAMRILDKKYPGRLRHLPYIGFEVGLAASAGVLQHPLKRFYSRMWQGHLNHID